MISMVVNNDVLVVLSMSVVNNFNCVQGCGEGGRVGSPLDSDWLSLLPSHQIASYYY